MRIWDTSLIPHLCQKHLCAMWREGLGCYNIVVGNKQGYRNHPATKEWLDAPEELHNVLSQVRIEMLSRGYNPKPLPEKVFFNGQYNQWQTLDEQIEILKAKQCKCFEVKK